MTNTRCMGCRPGGFRRRLIGSVLVATFCAVIALYRQTRDLPGLLGSFFQHRRLRVPHGDDLAAAHPAIAEVGELHRLAQMKVRTSGNAPTRVGQHALDQRLELEELQAARALKGFDHPWVDALQDHSRLPSLRSLVACGSGCQSLLNVAPADVDARVTRRLCQLKRY